MQPRHKWYRSSANMKVGDVVLVKEARVNYRPQYPKTLITEVYPGTDGNIRSVQLRFADGRSLARDIRKLVPLECHVKDAPPTAETLGEDQTRAAHCLQLDNNVSQIVSL